MTMRSDLKELFDLTRRIYNGKAKNDDEKKYIPMSLKLMLELKDIDDDDLMYIIYYRYMLGLKWIRLAEICGSFSPDAIRKASERKLKQYDMAA